jgi:hypothetical protein
MKKLKILINSKTSGKFKREQIAGRSHLVTTIMPIRGDITMNNIFYSDKEVTNSFMQLNMLPAPNGHPEVNGVAVPAFHPVANNKHNIGGFLRNPRKKGKRVFADFLIDEEVANNSEAGKETIRRIEAGERIGVSTGLGIAQVINKTGTDDFGVKFTREGKGFNFDHVATLLNEEAAGAHAGTELVLNEAEAEVLVHNAEWSLNELSTSDIHESIRDLIRVGIEGHFAWIQDIFPDSKTVVYSVEQPGAAKASFKQTYAVDQNDVVTLIDDKKEVIENPERFIDKPTTTNHQEVDEMDKLSIVLAIIGNSANKFTVADKDRLMAMSEDDVNKIVSTNALDETAAKELLTNAGFNFSDYEQFTTNKADFDLYLADKAETTKGIVDNIIANSEMTKEMLEGKSQVELDVINNMLTPEKIAVRLGEQHVNNSKSGVAVAPQIDWS